MNGWQRLWGVVSVIIGLLLMVVGERLVPSNESIALKFDKPLAEERQYLAEIKRSVSTQTLSVRTSSVGPP